MTRRRRPSIPQARSQTGQGSRYTPVDQELALERATIWVKWIGACKEVTGRDEKRIHQAFRLLVDEEKTDAYSLAVRQAHALGGTALTAILALSIGPSAFRDMRQKLQQEFPTILAAKRFHLLRRIRNYVRKFEDHGLTAEGKKVPFTAIDHTSTDEDDCNLDETDSAAVATSATSNPSDSQVQADPTSSQAVSFTSQWQCQTDLAGKVYELEPTDLLEFATGLVTNKISCPGPLLLTEPRNPLARPFFTVPVTNQLAFKLRIGRRQVM